MRRLVAVTLTVLCAAASGVAAQTDPEAGADTGATAEQGAVDEAAPDEGLEEGDAVVMTTPADGDGDGERTWSYSLRGFLFTAGVSGDVGIGPVQGDLDTDWDDFGGDFDYGVRAEFEAHNGRYGVLVDVEHMVVETDEVINTPALYTSNAKLRTGYAEVLGMMAIPTREQARPAPEGKTFQGDLFLGVRRMWASARVSNSLGNRATESEEWLDLVYGARQRWRVNEDWLMSLRGDLGGFDIGDSSDLTYSVTVQGDYALAERTSALFAWRYMMVDYDSSSYEQTLRTQSIMAGLEYRF